MADEAPAKDGKYSRPDWNELSLLDHVKSLLCSISYVLRDYKLQLFV